MGWDGGGGAKMHRTTPGNDPHHSRLARRQSGKKGKEAAHRVAAVVARRQLTSQWRHARVQFFETSGRVSYSSEQF